MKSKVVSKISRYCGRDFTGEEISWIRDLIAGEPRASRVRLSQLACEGLSWLRPDGRLKEMSCRVAMLRMQRDGLISLPPPRNRNANGRTRPALTTASDPRALPAAWASWYSNGWRNHKIPSCGMSSSSAITILATSRCRETKFGTWFSATGTSWPLWASDLLPGRSRHGIASSAGH